MALRTLVVGLGDRGREWLREVRRTPAFTISACVDSHPPALAAAQSELGLDPAVCFASQDEALARVACDVVIIATPPDDHRDACERALARRCAVLVEKPFTLTLCDATSLVTMAEMAGVPLLVAQNYRYMRAFRTARQFLASGRLGRLAFVQCQYFRVDHQMPPWLRVMDDSLLWGAGVHHLDAIRWLADEPVVQMLGDRFSVPGAVLPPGGSMRVFINFASGARATYTGSYESSGHEFFEAGQEFYLRLIGERGTLHVLHR